MVAFVLVHSPLVGPFTWALVAQELERKQNRAIVPALITEPSSQTTYWEQHAEAVARTIETVPLDEPVILVAHSGAGALLPAIRQASSRPVAAYIFVDAGIPQDGKSRLDIFFDPEAAQQFRRSAINGLLPTWTDSDLAEVIPDDDTRARFVAELCPLPLAAYDEPIPVFQGWPDALCAYIAFVSGEPYVYEASLQQAEQNNWPCVRMKGMHFHMLVDAAAVAGTLLTVTGQLGLVAT